MATQEATWREKAQEYLNAAGHKAGEIPADQYPLILALLGIGWAILDTADSIDRKD